VALALELEVVGLLLLAASLTGLGARLAVVGACLDEWSLLYLLVEHDRIRAEFLKGGVSLFHFL